MKDTEALLEVRQQLSEHYRRIIELLGEDTAREGLKKTPMRVAKAMQFLLKGYDEDPEAVLASAMFEEEDYKQMVIVKDSTFFRSASITCCLSSVRYMWPTFRIITSRG